MSLAPLSICQTLSIALIPTQANSHASTWEKSPAAGHLSAKRITFAQTLFYLSIISTVALGILNFPLGLGAGVLLTSLPAIAIYLNMASYTHVYNIYCERARTPNN